MTHTHTPMRFHFTHYIERGDDEIALAVIYDVASFVEATYWQPAEGGDVEIISVTLEGQPFATTKGEDDAVQTAAEERAQEDIADEAAAAEDYRADCRRDEAMMRDWDDR